MVNRKCAPLGKRLNNLFEKRNIITRRIDESNRGNISLTARSVKALKSKEKKITKQIKTTAKRSSKLRC